MTEQKPDVATRCLDAFPEWLSALPADAAEVAQLIGSDAPEAARRFAVAGINYLFKSLDLIPDGIEDLGYLDDAFVLRVASAAALEAAPGIADTFPTVRRLANDTKLIGELLGPDYARLVAYVKGLTSGAARGRTVDEIIGDAGVRETFVREVGAWSESYATPTFARDEKNIVKLQSFLSAKLPA